MSLKLLLDGKVELHCGDCLDVLKTLPANSIDSCVTDPPYHLTEVKTVGQGYGSEHRDGGRNGGQRRACAGFMGKSWDGGDIAQSVELWQQVYRVLRPGAHLLAFGGTRTYHRMACAIEDAGFEIRDTIMWLYGSGFPKSHDVSKGIDKAAGAERKIVGRRHDAGKRQFGGKHPGWDRPWMHDEEACERHVSVTAPATDAARQWAGWGTALKPSCEPIVLARKPLSEKTVAANVLKHGTGALNIDGCRVATNGEQSSREGGRRPHTHEGYQRPNASMFQDKTDWSLAPKGRWPANLIHDGSEQVVQGFPDGAGGGSTTPRTVGVLKYGGTNGRPSHSDDLGETSRINHDGQGSAARFFYTAKADSDDRLGSKHPTVKPLDLMQYLVRLVCPRGGTVLDMFAGTGTTGEAAWREGCKAVLIESKDEYQVDIRRRIKLCMAGPDERAREAVKARGNVELPGPLFEAMSKQ